MFNGNAMPSLADIAAVTGNGRNNDGMWGGDGWWAIIIFAMTLAKSCVSKRAPTLILLDSLGSSMNTRS